MMVNLLQSWGSIYANHAALRTLVTFVHVGALMTGGGLAVATDRAMLTARDDISRRVVLQNLARSHRLIIVALALMAVSGLLLFASDFETFLYSKFFWIKMGLVGLLMANGLLLFGAESRALAGDGLAWDRLRLTAIVSITLWLLTTLGGVALPNIG